jgi:stalled ribosome alternative rescue factor ArfA
VVTTPMTVVIVVEKTKKGKGLLGRQNAD